MWPTEEEARLAGVSDDGVVFYTIIIAITFQFINVLSRSLRFMEQSQLCHRKSFRAAYFSQSSTQFVVVIASQKPTRGGKL